MVSHDLGFSSAKLKINTDGLGRMECKLKSHTACELDGCICSYVLNNRERIRYTNGSNVRVNDMGKTRVF